MRNLFGSADVAFFSKFEFKYRKKALEVSCHIIITGDLNEYLLNLNHHNLRDTLLLNSLENIIRTPTRNAALLDPIIVPSDMYALDSGVIANPGEISDHSAT